MPGLPGPKGHRGFPGQDGTKGDRVSLIIICNTYNVTIL